MRRIPSYLTNVLSSTEAAELTTRLRIAELLTRGVTYRAIARKTGVGAATIARVAKHLKKSSGDIHGSQIFRNQYTFGHHT